MPPRPLPPGHPLRTFLSRLLNYKDKEIILRLAREKKNVVHNEACISFYPDYSVEVQQQRAQFTDVKKKATGPTCEICYAFSCQTLCESGVKHWGQDGWMSMTTFSGKQIVWRRREIDKLSGYTTGASEPRSFLIPYCDPAYSAGRHSYTTSLECNGNCSFFIASRVNGFLLGLLITFPGFQWITT